MVYCLTVPNGTLMVRRNGKPIIQGNCRIDRAIEMDSKLAGLISIDDLKYKEFGFEVIPFLEPVVIDGISYCHYYSGARRETAISNARTLLNKKHMSCIAGHKQGRDIAYGQRGDGKDITCIVAGSFYAHDESYMGHQGNNHWRGILRLNNVNDGSFEERFISLDYLMQRYF
jgi:hypothetical protein